MVLASEGGGDHAAGSWFHPLAKLLHLPDWILVSWLAILILVYFSRLGTRHLRLSPSGPQNVLELVYEGLEGLVKSIMGDQGKPYVSLVGSFFLYILVLNLLGLVPGLLSPTAYLTTTVSLGLVAVAAAQYYAIKELGFKDYVLHLCGEPLWMAPLMMPVHLIGEVSKPVSLAFRLFGNIFGEDVVILSLIGLSPVILWFIPIPLQLPMMVFAIFSSFVQALVFSILAAVYISLFVLHEDHGEGEH